MPQECLRLVEHVPDQMAARDGDRSQGEPAFLKGAARGKGKNGRRGSK
jgi:hypothetical protein